VNNPASVTVLDQKTSQSLAEFSQVYQMIVTEFLDAMGETGTGVSQVDLLSKDKTATEVNDRAFLRGSRDNFNKMMLQTTLKKLMYQLFEMLRDPKFVDKNTVIQVVGKDALEYFDKQGFSSWGINKDGYELVLDTANSLQEDKVFASGVKDMGQNMYDVAYQLLAAEGALDAFAEPMSPVMTAKGTIQKLVKDEESDMGYLSIDPESDYLGEFNFLPDVEVLTTPNPEKEYQSRSVWYNQAQEVEKTGALMQEGYRIKHKDILTKLGELIRIQNAEQYFEKVEPPIMGGPNEINQGGAGNQGVGPGGQPVSNQQPVQGPPGAPVSQAGGGVPQAGPPGMGGAVPLR
jgi:hypothetical protein